MRWKAIAGLATSLLLGAAPVPSSPPPLRDGAGEIRPLPQPAVVLFWAAWCAPCRAELAQIEALSAAAEPVPVIVVALDSSRRTQALLRDLSPHLVRYPASAASNPMALMPGGGAALPAALAIGQLGDICATARTGVDVPTIRKWRESCFAKGNR